MLASINHNLKKQHVITLVRFNLMKYTSFLLIYLGKDFCGTQRNDNMMKKENTSCEYTCQRANSLQKIAVKRWS